MTDQEVILKSLNDLVIDGLEKNKESAKIFLGRIEDLEKIGLDARRKITEILANYGSLTADQKADQTANAMLEMVTVTIIHMDYCDTLIKSAEHLKGIKEKCLQILETINDTLPSTDRDDLYNLIESLGIDVQRPKKGWFR